MIIPTPLLKSFAFYDDIHNGTGDEYSQSWRAT